MIRLGAAAAGALALTLLVTWPLARCLGSCLGPPPDTLVSTYFLAWVARALTTPGVALLDAPMFAPYSNTLALGEYLPAYAPVAIPVIALTGNPVVAHNVVLVALYAAAALGVYALARHLLGADGPAALAAVGFAFSARLLDQSYNLQTMAVAWVPWLLLAVERLVERPSFLRAALLLPLGMGLALSSMNMFAFTGVAMLVWLGVAAIQGRVRPGHVLRLAVVAAPGAALLWAYVAPYRRAAREWQLTRSLAEVEGGATTLAHAARLPPESLLHWTLSGGGAGAGGPVESVLLGVTLAILAGLGLAGVWSGRRDASRALVPYVVVGGVALVLAFGPTLHTAWGGVPLPYRALYALVPGFGAIRTPARFLQYVDLALALLAGAGALRVLERIPRSRRSAALIALVALLLAEAILIPFPGAVRRLDPAALPEAYRWLRSSPPGTVALGVPVGDWVNVAASALHLRRTVNGWSSFEPPRYRDLVAALEAFPDERTLTLIRGSGANVVLIDRAWLTPERAMRLAEPDSGLHLERVFPTHVLYRVAGRPPPESAGLRVTARIDAGRPCAVLQNASATWVPLYPARRLTVAPDGREGTRTASVTWLPLDLAPGAQHVECLEARPDDGLVGIIDGGGRRLRFAVRAGEPAASLEDIGP